MAIDLQVAVSPRDGVDPNELDLAFVFVEVCRLLRFQAAPPSSGSHPGLGFGTGMVVITW